MSTPAGFCLTLIVFRSGLAAVAYAVTARRLGRLGERLRLVALTMVVAVGWSGPGCGMPVKIVPPRKAAEKIFPLSPIYPGSVFTGFGEPKEGAKKIYVSGDIEQPGTYYLPVEATLYDLIMRMGRCGGNGDGRIIPTSVNVRRLGEDGKWETAKFKTYGVSADELRQVSLPPETVCYFPTRIL